MYSLWKGPEVDGITGSMLGKFVNCRHRFWLKYCMGLSEQHTFNHSIEFGNMWHEAEEKYATKENWREAVDAHAIKLKKEYPTHLEDIAKWSMLCKEVFPIYANHYTLKHSKKLKPIFQEESFNVVIPVDEFKVKLRGKIDGLFATKTELWLQENKTKGHIDIGGYEKSIKHNLQTSIYHIAIQQIKAEYTNIKKVAGTIYNIVRRPLSDKHSPRKRKAETPKEFYKRVANEIAKKPNEHFYRWYVSVSPKDVERMKSEIIVPLLKQVCMWWQTMKKLKANSSPFDNPLHYQTPFGVEQGLTMAFAGGGRGDFFDYLTTGSKLGLEQTKLFPEL